MGITIRYRGKIDHLNHVTALSDELIDIAEARSWSWTSLDDDWGAPPTARLEWRSDGAATITGHLGLKGVEMHPHSASESLAFMFDREGNLRDPILMVNILDGTLKKEDAWLSVKTQYAPLKVHTTIIKLLGYLKRRYISDLEVIDEGAYWETGDEETLKQKVSFLAKKIEDVRRVVSSSEIGDLKGLNVDEMASRIEAILLKKLANEE